VSALPVNIKAGSTFTLPAFHAFARALTLLFLFPFVFPLCSFSQSFSTGDVWHFLCDIGRGNTRLARRALWGSDHVDYLDLFWYKNPGGLNAFVQTAHKINVALRSSVVLSASGCYGDTVVGFAVRFGLGSRVRAR